MLAKPEPIREVTGADPRALSEELLLSTEPWVVRGLVSNWPAVEACRASPRAAADYLWSFYRGAPVIAMVGPPAIKGRFFYNDDLSGMNFRAERRGLNAVFEQIVLGAEHPEQPAIYVGSTDVEQCLPGFREINDVNLGERTPLASIWMGNQTRIAAHHDLPDNLACVVAGRRRFTLFPPSQVANLHIGPLDFTPAGQAISLVDFAAPDLERFPRFAVAMQHAQVAELEPGDAIFIPSLWWHQVEALASFNVLLNYWWRRSPAYMDTPTNALLLAIMSVRDLPPHERDSWRVLFEHYVFDADDDTASHIPARARRLLAPMDQNATRELRAQLLKRLNR